MAISKYELSISTDYVKDWGLVESIRELLQNALDQQHQNPSNEASWYYDQTEGTLRISNRASLLTKKTLLLGTTTKAGNAGCVGQFGEGYKLATLALLRAGYKVVIYNNSLDEVWAPRLVKSKRYDATVLTFFVEKKLFQKVTSNALDIIVSGISPAEYEVLQTHHLWLRDTPANVLLDTPNGDVLVDEQPGSVFVNGLFVQAYQYFKYSYNFKPGILSLNRDRNLANAFDLQWAASRVWSNVGPQDTKLLELIVEMLEANSEDVRYLSTVSSVTYQYQNAAADAFFKKHGTEAYPISSQEESTNVPKGYVPVIVSASMNSMIRSSALYVEPDRDEEEDEESDQYKVDKVIKELRELINQLEEPSGSWYSYDVKSIIEGAVATLEELDL